jgi:hypothetical protein
MGGAQPRVLVRRTGAGDRNRRKARLSDRRSFPLDGAVVPGLLLLVARDLASSDPPRVLAWRLSHDPHLAGLAGWLSPLVPAASGTLDRDPVALLLAALAALLALAYVLLAARGARPVARAALIAVSALVLVVLPTAAFVWMGAVTHRPYGQDGGVVQLPLAIDRILAGKSPYGADYSDTILGRQARVSSFWEEHGGNPILHHHAYLPGTHAVMAPFLLASRAAFGFFDPRFVTLLCFALVAWLAWRLAPSPEGKLAAAGVAALNPLVYWHQIFGANDLMFVAMVLGAVLLARGRRRLASAAVLGLACATKQLAWPFAPFLLVALSEARSLRDLLAPATWRRLLAPVAVMAVVFLLVVGPVAALDLRAFWGDIFAYNVGLPGADNYPLGGTPGFGFANYLIYFGRVSSLRDYFPFSIFYLLLVPIGLLLLRSQLRDGRPEWALATGSAALLASLYFSRVVHPNYLISAAVLLPVAILAARRSADAALAPLLMLALAVEIAQGALFRTTWEQASAAGLPARLGGLTAALAPRAGPGLTPDPLGLLFSATAAGLGVLYACAAVAGAGQRVRAFLVVLCALLVVAVPTGVLIEVGERTGVVRAQDAVVVQARADAARLVQLRSPYSPPPLTLPRGRELVSRSFRLDPPAELQPDHPLLPPGLSVLTALSRLAGGWDPRFSVLLALGALAALLSLVPGARGAGLLAIALLLPPLAIGTTLGSPAALPLLGLMASWWLARAGRPALAGALAGLAIAVDHRAALAAPLLVAARPAAVGSGRRALVSALLAYGAVVLPVVLLDPGAFVARLAGDVGRPGPGLGLFDILAYRGAEASASAFALAALAPLLAAGVTLLLLWRGSGPPLARAAAASLAGIVLATAVPVEVVAVPIVLLATAASTRQTGGS